MSFLTQPRAYWPTQEWQTVDPRSVGVDPEKLTLLETVVKARYQNINGIVIVRNGFIVFERYFHGYGPLDAHNIASVTKSITSALIGIAIDAGYIRRIDQKVLEFFPEYHTDADDVIKQAITIEHLLTMTAPFALRSRMGNEPLDRLRRQPSWVTYVLNLMGRDGQIGKFQYTTAGIHLLSAILTRTTGMCAREFANERLFRPIGVKGITDQDVFRLSLGDTSGEHTAGWVKDSEGNNAGGWGMTLIPRDMARFGFLYLNRGLWDGCPVVPMDWVEASTTRRPGGPDYGYLWWLKEQNGIPMVAAMGSGGNMICCVPELDLVVAIATPIVSKHHDPWRLLADYILPAVQY